MAITATEAPPVQLTRDARGIDAAVALLSQPDACLEDALMLLRRVAVADLDAISTVDPSKRIQGLCALVAKRLREQYDDTIRCAPPAAIREVVRDAVTTCKGPRCETDVAPWEDEGPDFCSAACRVEDSVARGDDEPFDMSGSTPGVER